VLHEVTVAEREEQEAVDALKPETAKEARERRRKEK